MNSMVLLPAALSELFVEVAQTGKINLTDRYGLMAALLGGQLDDQERRAIDRILQRVEKGRIQVVE